MKIPFPRFMGDDDHRHKSTFGHLVLAQRAETDARLAEDTTDAIRSLVKVSTLTPCNSLSIFVINFLSTEDMLIFPFFIGK